MEMKAADKTKEILPEWTNVEFRGAYHEVVLDRRRRNCDETRDHKQLSFFPIHVLNLHFAVLSIYVKL